MGKGKKKGWKKLPRDADEDIHNVNLGRQFDKLPDEEMFVVDTAPLPTEDEKPPNMTFKQKAALNHKLYRSTLKEEENMDMKDVKNFQQYHSSIDSLKKSKSESAKNMYDLWEEEKLESTSEGFGAVGIRHYEKVLQRTRRKAPKSTRLVPNILPAVEIPNEGASYNPSLDSYITYANDIEKEEIRMEKDEKRLTKSIPAKMVAYDVGTKFEDFRKLLSRDQVEDAEEDESPVLEDAPQQYNKKQPKSKTIKQKKQALQRKNKVLQKDKNSIGKRQLQEFNNLKKIRNEVNKSVKDHNEKMAARKQQKVLDSLTKRGKLGRGEFKAYEEPILLPEELSGSLRQLPSRGNILEERFKSLQKRNILPIAGERKKSNRKVSLKVKFVEKRSAKEIKRGSRVL